MDNGCGAPAPAVGTTYAEMLREIAMTPDLIPMTPSRPVRTDPCSSSFPRSVRTVGPVVFITPGQRVVSADPSSDQGGR